MTTPCDDATRLALAAAQGDQQALESFVKATRDDVRRFVGCLADRRVADDLTQDTYLRAFRSIPTFGGRASGRTWLLAIARRAVADHFRHESSRPRLQLKAPESMSTVATQSERHDDRVELEMLLADLDERRREAFVLTQVLDFAYAEAAEICACPIGTIRSRVARAREDLVAAYQGDRRKAV